jgi:putative transposase
MGRALRNTPGGYVYHVLNRANGRATIFRKDRDYAAFLRVLAEAQQEHPLRLLVFCLMLTHWHLVVWPEADDQVSSFMHWRTLTDLGHHVFVSTCLLTCWDVARRAWHYVPLLR